MRKLAFTFAAIAVSAALVLGPSASASPVLTGSGGTTIATGTLIRAYNVGTASFTGGFNVECSTVVLEGKVTANTGTTIAAEIPLGWASFQGTGAGVATWDCTSALGDVKVTINSRLCLHTSNASDNVTVTGCGANITFTLHMTSAGISCAYSTASVTGTYFTNAYARITLTQQPAAREAGQNIFCPSTGSLNMAFDIYSGSGTLLAIS